MKKSAQQYKTNYKYGRPVLEGSGKNGTYNSLAVDCPFVFWHNGSYRMLHVGFDGKGYQTALSESKDLLHWSEGIVLFPREEGDGWDKVGIAGLWLLKENDLRQKPVLKKINNKYWMIYHSYPNEGYESGSAQIGLAWTEDENLLKWNRFDTPILSYKDGGAWEQGGLYKGCLIEEKGTYYLFYNAKQRDISPWHEQIGMAVSEDMLQWRRFEQNPIIKNTAGNWDCMFAADPYIVKDGDGWVMFYYGYDGSVAVNGVAFSKDLIHWEKWNEPILKNGTYGDIDCYYAHKPSVIMENDTIYHFYCAVRESRSEDNSANIATVSDQPSEYRCITVASNKPFGKM